MQSIRSNLNNRIKRNGGTRIPLRAESTISVSFVMREKKIESEAIYGSCFLCASASRLYYFWVLFCLFSFFLGRYKFLFNSVLYVENYERRIVCNNNKKKKSH